MKLTDSVIKTAASLKKPYKLSDGHGLVLLVQPNGAKWWRFWYRFSGKEKTLSLGIYPKVSLKNARASLTELKELLNKNIDPSFHRVELKLRRKHNIENSFESIARLWWDSWRVACTPRHAHYVLRRLEADIFPIIGARPIKEITAPVLLVAIKKIEARGALDIAKRALNTCNQIFRHAIAQT